jgi:hypothetical protein
MLKMWLELVDRHFSMSPNKNAAKSGFLIASDGEWYRQVGGGVPIWTTTVDPNPIITLIQVTES